MKLKIRILSSSVFIALAGSLSAAVTYNDVVSDVNVPGNPFPHIDITSVVLSNTATDLTFQVFLNGSPVATDWGKYMIGISTEAGGDTGGNGWGRPISMQDGMEHWIGAWADGGNGAQLWDYTGSWNQDSVTGGVNPAGISISKDSSSITISLSLASLGLSVSDTFTFDVYTSGGGGGDGAVDSLALGTSSISNWGDSYQTSSANALSYTVVPEPASSALGLIGAALLFRRRRN